MRFKKHPLQNRTNVQLKGGVKGLLNNVKKTALFLADGFPYSTFIIFKSLEVAEKTHLNG